MSRRCCCCIPIVVGAAILGVIGLLFCALELTTLVPYVMRVDIEVFNPIEKNLETIYMIFEDILEKKQK